VSPQEKEKEEEEVKKKVSRPSDLGQSLILKYDKQSSPVRTKR